VAALFFERMRFDPTDPHARNNDRFILSKGHAAPLLYAAWAEAGHIDPDELEQLRDLHSPLEGHPTPRLDFVDVATGSLGQGLAAGVGMAIAAKLDGLHFLTYVLMGDGEAAEGSVWEAAALASARRLGNLVAIVDVNRLGQSQPTALGWDVEAHRKRFEAFGWLAVTIDGHAMNQIVGALELAGSEPRPLAIVAKTVKGKGIPGVENQLGWHGRPLSPDQARAAIDHLIPNAITAKAAGIVFHGRPAPPPRAPAIVPLPPAVTPPLGAEIATRKAFGNAVARLGASEHELVVLDGDVENSTYTEEFARLYPERFIECYIAEQTMIGAATGLGARGKVPFASTFAAFFSRAGDQLRMAAISQANVKLVGTHAGTSIGEDGPSQMGLEDIAFMRALPGSTVLSAADAVSTEQLVAEMATTRGLIYLRTTRPPSRVIYGPDETFPIGGAKVLRESLDDRVAVVATGVTVVEALAAYDALAAEDIHIAVIDAYTIKPLATEVIATVTARTHGLVLTVEDHYAEGGLGDAVASELGDLGARVHKLAVYELPHSGKKNELMREYHIDARAIVDEVHAMLERFSAFDESDTEARHGTLHA
jgi:transketolase